MGEIFRLQYVHSYPQVKIGWYVYDLVCYPAPIAALRNLNEYDEEEDSHATFSWEDDSNLRRAVSLTCDLLKAWQAFRSRIPGLQEQLIPAIQQHLPDVILTFQREVKDLGIRRIVDVHPSDSGYSSLLLNMAIAVNEIAKLKKVSNPMLGSKVMHFFFPEFFPVWDTEWIKKQCLVKEKLTTNRRVLQELGKGAGSEYSAYVHLMVTDLAKTPDYAAIRQACLQRAWVQEEVAAWHYDDIAPTVFEICLLGKHVG